MEKNEKDEKGMKTFSFLSDKGKASSPDTSADKREKKERTKKVNKTVNTLISLNNPNYIQHSLKKGVTIVLVKDHEEDYSKLETVKDVIELDKRKPASIVGFIPSLYHEFIDKTKGTIDPKVKIGDIVTVKRKFVDKKGDIPRTVTNYYFKSLHDMTVIVAVLNDGDFCLANRLEICK